MTTTVPAPTPPSSPTSPGTGAPLVHALGPFTPGRPRAPWGNRVLATLLDSAVIASVAWLATGDAPSMAAVPVLGDTAQAGGAAWAGGTLLVIGALQAYTGMSPGKRVVGICVVDAGSGRPIGMLGTIVRWLAHVLDAVLFVGYLRAAVHVEGRTFADSLLGTVAQRTRTPEPHRWVAAARRSRDVRAPWLRWPPRATSAIALTLCAAAAAMSVVQGSGASTDGPTALACTHTGSSEYTSELATEHTTRWQTRAGIARPASDTWRVASAWSHTPGTTQDDVMPGVTLTVRSPDGETLGSGEPTTDLLGDDMLSTGETDGEVVATEVASERDLTGWTATSTLVDDDGTVVATCTGTVPRMDGATG